MRFFNSISQRVFLFAVLGCFAAGAGVAEPDAGTVQRDGVWKAGVAKASFVPNPAGPVDHDVPLLRIDSDAGLLRGVVFGYACHATALLPDNTRFKSGNSART